MGPFFAYIIKSTICLTLFYLFYRLLLSKDTFHRFNRIALLSLIPLSVIIPFVNLSTKEATVIQYPMINLEQFLSVMEQPVQAPSPASGLQLLIILYIAGILFFIGRLIFSMWQIIRTIRSGEKMGIGKNIKLIVIDQNIAPFSWMKYIVISRTDWKDNRDSIIRHEMAHIQYRHSWDIFISELCTVFHWFNPAAWLLKQELQNIHEYEADESVINQGIDVKQYQLLLIKKAVGTQRFNSMANSFNHSKLKKRITMMLKSKSNAWGRLKYLYVLPLVAITSVAFARPEISQELDRISSTKISELPLIKEVLPEKNEPLVLKQTSSKTNATSQKKTAKTRKETSQKEGDVNSHVQKHVDELTKSVHEKVASERTYVQSVVDNAMAEINDHKGQLSPEQETAINQKVEEAVKESESRIEAFVGIQEKNMEKSLVTKLPADAKMVVIIDGVEASEKELHALNPQQIESVSLEMNSEVMAKYGKDIKGTILVKTRKF